WNGTAGKDRTCAFTVLLEATDVVAAPAQAANRLQCGQSISGTGHAADMGTVRRAFKRPSTGPRRGLFPEDRCEHFDAVRCRQRTQYVARSRLLRHHRRDESAQRRPGGPDARVRSTALFLAHL